MYIRLIRREIKQLVKVIMNQELCMDKKNMKLKVNREPITDDSGDPFENVFLGVLSSN